MHVAPDGLGLWVPPNEFSNGLYYTDGRTTIEAGRTYDLETPGGTAFVVLHNGFDNFITERFYGSLIAETGDRITTVKACGWPQTATSDFCDALSADAATHISVSESVHDPHANDAGELFVIALPASAY